jgi:mono/diheme cytochrome c family protein
MVAPDVCAPFRRRNNMTHEGLGAPPPLLASGVKTQIVIVLSIVLAWGSLLAILAFGQPGSNDANPVIYTLPVTWDNAIGPLMEEHCVACHGGSAGLYLDSYAAALKGGARGPAVVPGQGSTSLLVRSLRGVEPGLARMPLNRPPMSASDINRIAAWIDAGAPLAATTD